MQRSHPRMSDSLPTGAALVHAESAARVYKEEEEEGVKAVTIISIVETNLNQSLEARKVCNLHL